MNLVTTDCARLELLRQKAYIAGEWTDGPDRIAVTDPACGSIIGNGTRQRNGRLNLRLAEIQTTLLERPAR